MRPASTRSAFRRRGVVRPLCVLLAALGCAACDRGGSSGLSSGQTALDPSYLTPDNLNQAINQLLAPLPKPIRLLSLTALNGVVVLQVQDAKDPRSVQEYRFSRGSVTGPVPVELQGPGKLTDNLFRADSVDPHIAERVLTSVRAEHGDEIRKLVLTRNLPTSMDIQFRVFLKTPGGDRVIAADKNGRLLGPLTTSPSPNNSPNSPATAP